MNEKNSEYCPQSADHQHKPDPSFRWAGRQNVALDERRDVLVTEVLCVACGATGRAETPLRGVQWSPELHG